MKANPLISLVRALPLPSLVLLPLLLAGCVSGGSDPARAEAAEKSGVCHVHDRRMTTERTRIVYGLTAVPMDAAYDAQTAKFPFAHRSVYGGCVTIVAPDLPGASSPEFATIHICDDCDAAKARWVFWHPSDPWAKIWKRQIAARASEPAPETTIPPLSTLQANAPRPATATR